MNTRIAIGLAVAVLSMLFIVQNIAVVEVKFLFWSIEMSRALLMVILLVAGIVIGWLLAGFFRIRK